MEVTEYTRTYPWMSIEWDWGKIEYSSCTHRWGIKTNVTKYKWMQFINAITYLPSCIHQLKIKVLTVHVHQFVKCCQREFVVWKNNYKQTEKNPNTIPNVTFDKGPEIEILPTVFNGGVIGVNKLTLHKLYGKRRLSCGGNIWQF